MRPSPTPSTKTRSILAGLVAMPQIANVIGLWFGYADHAVCLASNGRPRVYETWRLPGFWELLAAQIPSAAPSALLFASISAAAVLVSRSLWVGLVLLVLAAPGFADMLGNMSWKWHQCDRKGCTRCWVVELQLAVTTLIAVVALVVAPVAALLRRSRASP